MGRPATRRPALLAAALLGGALLAGCGASTSSTVAHTQSTGTGTGAGTTVTLTQTVTTPAPTTTAATTTAASTPTSTTTTTTTTTSVAATPPCTAATLTPVFLASNGATGNVVLTFALRNRGATACHTYGFPGVQFTGASGLLATNSVRTTNDLLGSTPAVRIVIAPGQEASFRMIAPDMGRNGSTSGCARATGLQVIAPDDTATMRVALASPVLECGRTSVSPLQPDGSAQPGV